MIKAPSWSGLVLATFFFLTVCVAPANAQEALRAEVIKPLQQAQELNKQNKNAEALARFAEVDALPAANPLEVFTIERLRAVVHLAAGNPAAAGKALEKALQTERGTVADRLALMENLVLIQYRAKQYADTALWAGRYLALGGQRDQFKQLQGQALYLSGQYQPAVDILQPRLAAELAAGRVPDEIDIRLLANGYLQVKNSTGYVSTLETLVRFYPKPEVWADLLFRVLQRKDFPGYLEIDLRRLMQKTGAVSAKPESPEEGTKLNTMLAEATRLQQEDDKQLPQLDAQLAQARDGNPWVNTGLNLALAGQADRGAGLMAQGIEKGGLRQPEAARLRLAYAQLLADQKDPARKTLQAITGASPEALLARLWLLHLQAKT